MANLGGFDANTVQPSTGFDPIPNGEYVACIVESEEKTTKKGDGSYLKLTFEILEGPFAKRKLWTNLNLHNPNMEAVNIARAELSAICRSCGKLTPNDSEELHNIPMKLKVAVAKNNGTGEMENRIKKYEPVNGQPANQSAPRATAGAGAGTGNAAPWKRN